MNWVQTMIECSLNAHAVTKWLFTVVSITKSLLEIQTHKLTAPSAKDMAYSLMICSTGVKINFVKSSISFAESVLSNQDKTPF